MTTASINTLVSEVLILPKSLCQSLAAIVQNKTGGIILFVINFLRFLNEEGLLRYNLTAGRWDYNTELIQREAMSGESGNYLTQQMTRLGHEVQLALKVSACFGFCIDADVLQSGLSGLGINVKVIGEIVSSGFLQKLDNQFIWAHDKVHEVS